MKTKIWLMFLLLLLMGASCKKDKNDGLTPETQTGANTFSCKVNGKLFVPKASLFGGPPLYSQISTIGGTNTLIISAGNENTYVTDFYFNIVNFNGEGTYNIDIGKGTYVECYLNIPVPNREKPESGFIKITKYEGKIVSGLFEFSFKHGDENILVTSGRFDLTLRGL